MVARPSKSARKRKRFIRKHLMLIVFEEAGPIVARRIGARPDLKPNTLQTWFRDWRKRKTPGAS